MHKGSTTRQGTWYWTWYLLRGQRPSTRSGLALPSISHACLARKKVLTFFLEFKLTFPGNFNSNSGPVDLESILTFPGNFKIDSREKAFSHLVGLQNKGFRKVWRNFN